MATPRLMIVLFVAIGLVVAAVVLLLTRSWWALAAALVVHAVATISVVWYTLRRTGQSQDKPHPVTEARIEEERLEAQGRVVQTDGRRSAKRAAPAAEPA